MHKQLVGTMNKELTPIKFEEFLANTPPHSRTLLDSRLGDLDEVGVYARRPDIKIHCVTDECVDKGLLTFRCLQARSVSGAFTTEVAVYKYVCPNCRVFQKLYTFVYFTESEKQYCIKLGEYPNFGPPLPARLKNMFGSDRELFMKGRRCENQGLGVGAFSYYRRVVEQQKNRIFDQIIKATKVLEPSSELIAELEAAKKETQFSKSLLKIKAALPQTLLIHGFNPLDSLHNALSEGLHAGTDEECLELASGIRLVIVELSGKLNAALSDNKELSDAMTRLNNIKIAKSLKAPEAQVADPPKNT